MKYKKGKVINTTNAETLAQLKEHWFLNAKTLINSYKLVDSESRQMILETLSALFKIAKDNFFEEHIKTKENRKSLV